MKRKHTKSGLLKQIEACKKTMARERDKLRELLNDAEDIFENCDEGVRQLEDATATLSRYL